LFSQGHFDMMRRMRCLLFLLLGAGASVWGQSNVEFANLREDVRLAVQRVGELSLRVEQLERENALLKAQVDAAAKTFATVAQVNETIADVNRSLKSAVVASRSETLELVGKADRPACSADGPGFADAGQESDQPTPPVAFLGGISQGRRELHCTEGRDSGHDCEKDRSSRFRISSTRTS
jgi:cell division protein FtsB